MNYNRFSRNKVIIIIIIIKLMLIIIIIIIVIIMIITNSVTMKYRICVRWGIVRLMGRKNS